MQIQRRLARGVAPKTFFTVMLTDDESGAVDRQPGLLIYYTFDQETANGNNTGKMNLFNKLNPDQYVGSLQNFGLTGSSSNWTNPTDALIFTVSSATVCQEQAVSLSATGCRAGTIVWSTGTIGHSLTLTASGSNNVLTATCTIGTCSSTASGSVVVSGLQPPPAQILRLQADESACPVRLLGQGKGTSFVFTNTQGYVFSNVNRVGGTYDLSGLEVRQLGVYTLMATYSNECGSSQPISQTVTVNRRCP